MKTTEEIIEQIARENNTTPDEVEREINLAIQHAWENGGLKKLFPERPTIEQFIAMVVDQIKNGN